MRFRSLVLATATVFAGVVVTSANTLTAAAAPGTPGTPQDPLVVYTEDFEHNTGNAAVHLTDYTGAPPVNATYTADPAWLTHCSGWIANSFSPEPVNSECFGFWQEIPQLAGVLGQYAGTGQGNHAMGEESSFFSPGPDKVVVETENTIALSGASRFLTFSVDVAEIGCAGVHSLLEFYLMSGSTAIPAFNSPIEACVNPPTTIGGIPVGTYTSNGAVLFSGSSMGLRLVNGEGGGQGNDFAIDNIRVLDVTPQLDKTFSPATVTENGTTTLTYTITNTSELSPKNGWSFTDALPAGLIAGVAGTNCPGTTVSGTPSTVSVSGNLASGQAACSVTVQVSAADPGTYQSCAANVTSAVGISLPGCASVRFTAAPTAAAGGPYSGQEGASIAIAGAASDADSGSLSTTWTVAPASGVDAGATCTVATPAALSTSVSCTDDGTYTLALTVSDGFNPPTAVSTTLTLFNQAPTVDITAPADGIVVPAGTVVPFTAPFADVGANDTHTCTLDFDDGSPVGAGSIAGGVCSASHPFTVAGPHNVLVTVTDDDGASATDVVQVVVDAPPVVDAGGPYSGVEGATVPITGAVDEPAATHTWTVAPASGVDAGAGCVLGSAGALSTSVSCTDDGTYTLTLTAADGVNPPVTSSTTLTLANAAPVVTITAPTDQVIVPVRTTVSVAAPFTDAGANDTHTCTIDFDDGSPVVAGTIVDGTCAASRPITVSGSHDVLVTVTDDDGGVGTDTVRVIVNSAPEVDAGGPYSGQEGTAVELAGTVTDPDGPALTTSWTVTPGAGVDSGATCAIAAASAVSTSVTCTDDGSYTLTLTAADGLNPPVAVSTTLTLFNVAPVVAITAPADDVVVATGAVVDFTAPFTDAGANDTHTCTYDFDDGSPVAPGGVTGDVCAASHPFTAAGPHNVLVTVTDDDGASATDIVRVIVNAPPVVSAGGPYSGTEGAAIAIAGTVTDPDGPTLTTTWTLSAGAPCAIAAASSVSTSVTCTDNGSFTLTLTASDGVNAPVAATATLTVANVAPTVTITAPANGALFTRGTNVPVTASFTDPGSSDTHTCSVNFGDGAVVPGTITNGTCAASHAYTALGAHDVVVTVTDDDGGVGTATVRVVSYVPGAAWAVSATGPITIARTPNATCPPNSSLTQVGLNVPALLNVSALTGSCTVDPQTGTTVAESSVSGASLLGGVISISDIESSCVAGAAGISGTSRVGTINGQPIGGGSGSITIPLVATVHYNQTVATPDGRLSQYAIRVVTLLGQEIVLAGCQVG